MDEQAKKDLEEQAKEEPATLIVVVQALLCGETTGGSGHVWRTRVKSDESLPPEDVIYGMECIYTFHSKDYMFISIGFPFISPLL